MEVAPVSKEAVVKVKFNSAQWFWNKIMQHKNEHGLTNYKIIAPTFTTRLKLTKTPLTLKNLVIISC
jgi:hypothetical protein